MTILLEMSSCKDGLRAHPIKDKYILSGNSRILHLQSEDILTANVFGILKNLNPAVWLSSFLDNGCKYTVKEFPLLYGTDNFSMRTVLLWKDLDAPPSDLEGVTQADVFIELKKAVVLIECKFSAPLSKSVSTDRREKDPSFWWDQAIRNIVRGYSYVHTHSSEKDFFFVVLSMNEKEKTFSQYEDSLRIKDQVERRITKDPQLRMAFPEESINDISVKLSRRIRWVKWVSLKEALQKCDFDERGDFKPQSMFRDDLVSYLEMKINLCRLS